MSELMTADEARIKSTRAAAAQTLPIGPLIRHVGELIRLTSEAGQRSVRNPLDGLRMPITPEMREAVWQALVTRGYSVARYGADQGFEVRW